MFRAFGSSEYLPIPFYLFQATMAFTFASVSTLQLYSGMMGLRASADQKEKRYLSISSMSTGAGLLGTALVLPLLFPSVKSAAHDGTTVR